MNIYGRGVVLYVPQFDGVLCAPCQAAAGPGGRAELGTGFRPATSQDIQAHPECLSCGERIPAMSKSKHKNPAPLWLQEFGADFKLPKSITAARDLVDVSWSNDVCPSFALAGADLDGEFARLWADHPRALKREDPELPRFRVYDAAGATLYEGGSAALALAALRNAPE